MVVKTFANRQAVVVSMDRVLVDAQRLMRLTATNFALRNGIDPLIKIGDQRGRIWPEELRQHLPGVTDDDIRIIQHSCDLDAEQVLNNHYGLVPPVGKIHYLLASLPVGAWAISTDNSQRIVQSYLRNAHLPRPTVVTTREHSTATSVATGLARTFARLGVEPRDGLLIASSRSSFEAAALLGVPTVAMNSVPVAHRAVSATLRDFSDVQVDSTSNRRFTFTCH